EGDLRPLRINGQASPDVVNIGRDHTVADIFSPVTITNRDSSTAVTVDDEADPTLRAVTLSNVTVDGDPAGRISISGPTPANIDYKYADTNQVIVKTGTGGANVNVLAAGVPTKLEGHGPNTTVNVGNAGRLTDIRGAVTITNPPNLTTVNVDDSADP